MIIGQKPLPTGRLGAAMLLILSFFGGFTERAFFE
jgi:hypothetical protein